MKLSFFLTFILIFMLSKSILVANDNQILNEDVRAFNCPPNAARFCSLCISGSGDVGIPSTSCTSGSLVVNGGAGINGDLNVCGYINANDDSVVDPELKNYKLHGITVLDATGTNLSVGLQAGPVANGFANTFVGSSAGVSGSANTAVGNRALSVNANGTDNTAIGNDSQSHNISGLFNTSVGAETLFFNINGSFNTALGNSALFSGTGNSRNTAIGFGSLFRNITDQNTAIGFQALSSNTTGSFNTAVGTTALSNNVIGDDNTALGFDSLLSCTGSNNVAVGSSAGGSVGLGNDNTIVGAHADAPDFSSCIVLGSNAAATSSNQLVIASSTNPVGPITIVSPAAGSLAATGAIAFLPVIINGTAYSLALFNP